MADFDELMRGLSAAGLRPIAIADDAEMGVVKDQILPEARIMQMREWLAKIQRPNPFQSGDLATIRPHTGLRATTDLVMIIEVRTSPKVRYDFGHGDVRLLDTRVMIVDGAGDMATCWVEHWQLEPHTGEQ